ncbi:FAD-binding oxidoreductase [Aspergillus fijiensis CBS 313.89]|uniref:FAD-binding domain-containing protein n=1 Tax=Aspergillus fijiensis CBS 313.89 TaxID=1448319 RepID=A0A8G1RFB6_9EURO|nr:FAD-binding domain-containing protein [Aspergillus fijiensis CBS 313.89]RAK71698.1 FAD-binding domain-containing protein [Aspergillus fijiensis CBS 313.89]
MAAVRPAQMLAVLSIVAGAAASNITALLPHLSSSSEVFYPKDADWGDIIQRWTAWDEPTFSLAIKPGSVADLQTIVKFATSQNLPFLASGGGHGYSTSFGALQQGLQIDMGSFDSIQIDAEKSTMTIGGSVKFSQIMEPLFNAGKEIRRYQGLHGLIIDALESVELVTVKGDLITVSATENADLFWGLRGAGFNYGIVTSATYKVYDLTNKGNVLNADFMFPAELNETYFEILASYDTLPAALSLYTLVMNDAAAGPVILLNAVYPGPEQEGLDLLAPFLNLTYLERNISMITWDAVDADAGFGLAKAFCVNGEKHDMWSLGVRTIDAATHIAYFNQLAQFWSDYPAASGSTWQVEYFPVQAVTAVADASTAYPHREIRAHEYFLNLLSLRTSADNSRRMTDPVFMIRMFSFNLTDSSIGTSVDDFALAALETFNATSGFDDLHIYVSYAHGTEGLDPMYGSEKLSRLLALKKQWDPQGFFSYNNGLPH